VISLWENHYGSHQEIHSRIWTTTSTLYTKTLQNSDHPGILTQDKNKSLETSGKISIGQSNQTLCLFA
jgi:hypothetical protein